MVGYPELVGGEGRFCTVLMEAFGGMLIGKVGALGIAVKIEDGNMEILYAVVAEILEQLQIGTAEMRQQLAVFHHLKRLNTANIVIGKVSLPFKLRPWCN
ncbi:hypothetical protein SLS58_011247 [Diplodia intermedia]|uniref:LAGLIDADG endonuclease n=1 Tax=Diplodia intermedia TaxID=856260 RepID=A0ABR3T0D2_9PEZI